MESVGESVSQLDNRRGSVIVSCYCEELVAEAGDSSGSQRKGKVRLVSLYQATASEDCNILRRPSVSYSDL
jgi:hypothetical protein